MNNITITHLTIQQSTILTEWFNSCDKGFITETNVFTCKFHDLHSVLLYMLNTHKSTQELLFWSKLRNIKITDTIFNPNYISKQDKVIQDSISNRLTENGF